MKVLYPKVTGALCAKISRGLSGQDAKNGMIIVISSPCSDSMNTYRGGVSSTVKARDYKDVTDIVVEEPKTKMKRKYLARRLTPTECLSLQGLPKWWSDGVKGWSASRVYQLAGNGLALPCAIDVLGRIVDYVERTRDGN